jgi:D-glycerate 3-kinase
MYPQLIREFVDQESLPETYAADTETWFLPLIEELHALIDQSERPLIIGISGAQGTGKSTLAGLMSLLLGEQGYRVARLSLDDFYLSRARRTELAQRAHPLLASRGVPGTHDTAQAIRALAELSQATAADHVALPVFDKSRDDCASEDQFKSIQGPIDVILLEGWFTGAAAQSAAELEVPVNELERNEDRDGRWRHFVNQQLGTEYQPLFARIQFLIMLQAPDFGRVFEWRSKQESKLRARSGEHGKGLMDAAALSRFVQHFERLTRHCLNSLPGRADLVFRLDDKHRIAARLDKSSAN